MNAQQYDIGLVGLGVMGRNLVLNMADHGYAVAGYDKNTSQISLLQKDAKTDHVKGVPSLKEFVNILKVPRSVIMLVPAGSAVDEVIRSLLPLLEKGDLIIDGGNSYYKDTDLRANTMSEHGLNYFGMGISGGEHGARYGPSMMPGGSKDAYERVRKIFEAIAAKVDDDPCVAYLGPGSAGHYVKMVHNGIEYGLMQLISETYHLMKEGLGFDDDKLHTIYDQWNSDRLGSFLMEITSEIFCQPDKETGKRLVDVILDEAKQKGTGRWTSQDAMDLQVPVPVIDMAVNVRHLSALKNQRIAVSKIISVSGDTFNGDKDVFVESTKNALFFGMIITYAQGMALLKVASIKKEYNLNLEMVARIWRGGCIIRSKLLEDIRAAFQRNAKLDNLLLDSHLAGELMSLHSDVRSIIHTAIQLGIPLPAFSASLAYFDELRREWLPANLIQAQRDFFGAHTYERVDEKGVFHTHWEEE